MDISVHLNLQVDDDLDDDEINALTLFLQEATAEALAIQDLIGECGGPWSVHPDYPPADWMTAVESFDTRLGYWDWVLARLVDEADQKPAS